VDAYLLTLNHSAPSGPWRFEINNNEPEGLRFIVFISHEENETLQPWAEIDDKIELGAIAESFGSIVVKNLGSKTLNIFQEVGDKFGPADSILTFFAIEPQVDPHDSVALVLACPPLGESSFPHSRELEHLLKTDDPLRPLTKIQCKVVFPALPPTHCRENDGCREFVPRMPPDEFQCETCFHDAGFHGLPSDPDPTPE
jgi:hypothetical protein